ncbi:MAG: HAD hydrolase-like protein [Spirochaetales bacterium]|nr:HAD hydrolase-like protein [Leptospiraceae bacterium]MCP5483108.1 HAD hydrolase-like protein [Spirochaetales bacterium]MCP5484548.1 HAD hydrolase-like protein [Spirochaetales bacterium]
MKEALLFDLDGTLIDSLGDLTESLNWALLQSGLSPRTRSEVRRFIGDGMRVLVDRAAGSAGPPSERVFGHFLEHYRSHCLDSTRLFPGVSRLMPALGARYHCAVLTNKSAEFAHQILDGLGVSRHFQVIVGGDSFAVRKPHGLVVRETLKRLSSARLAAIIVGDHRADLEAARNSRQRAVYCCFGFGRPGASRVERRVRSFLELGPLLGVRG